jgi:hypothetical protein
VFGGALCVATWVVDCVPGPGRLGLAAEFAALLEGEHVPMASLSASALDRTVRRATAPSTRTGPSAPESARSAPNLPRKAA